MIDDKLTWKHHIDLVKSKLSRSCAIMYRASFLIDRRGMQVVYFSLFLPNIMYCAEIWGNSYSTSSKCLFMLQKRVIRLICGAIGMDHTNMLIYDQRILKLPDVVKLKTAIIMLRRFTIYYRLMYSTSSTYMSRLIQPDRIVISNTTIHVPL